MPHKKVLWDVVFALPLMRTDTEGLQQGSLEAVFQGSGSALYLPGNPLENLRTLVGLWKLDHLDVLIGLCACKTTIAYPSI